VFYFLLTGRRPFDGANLLEIIRRVRDETPAAPSSLQPGLSPQFDAICMRCLEKDPSARFASAADLGAELDRLLGTQSPTATFGSHSTQQALPGGLKAPVRRRLGWAVGAVALAVVLGVAAYALRPGQGRSTHQETVSDPTPATMPAAPLSVVPPQEHLSGALNVRIWDPKNDHRRGLSLDDPGALPLHPGDQIRVEAEANRPAYLYIIWIGTDGAPKPVYPWKPGDWAPFKHEQRTANISLPEPVDGGWPMEGGPGMETLVLLGRDEPISAVAIQDLFGDLPKQRLQNSRSLVWFDQGQFSREKTRSPQFFNVEDLNDPILTTQRRLSERFQPYFPLFRAVSFANEGH
jgi:hypothetical protein